MVHQPRPQKHFTGVVDIKPTRPAKVMIFIVLTCVCMVSKFLLLLLLMCVLQDQRFPLYCCVPLFRLRPFPLVHPPHFPWTLQDWFWYCDICAWGSIHWSVRCGCCFLGGTNTVVRWCHCCATSCDWRGCATYAVLVSSATNLVVICSISW